MICIDFFVHTRHFHTQSILFLIFFKLLESKLCCQYNVINAWCAAIYWSMVDLPGIALLKKMNFPSFRRYQLPVTGELVVKLCLSTYFSPCHVIWDYIWMELVWELLHAGIITGSSMGKHLSVYRQHGTLVVIQRRWLLQTFQSLFQHNPWTLKEGSDV